MKTIYCIEEWAKNDESIRDGSFWSALEEPWKLNSTPIINEFDDEEEFKNYLMDVITSCGVIGRVFSKDVELPSTQSTPTSDESSESISPSDVITETLYQGEVIVNTD